MESNIETGMPVAEEVRQMIATRAYEIYELRGAERGNAAEDWFRAEREVLAVLSAVPVVADKVSKVSKKSRPGVAKKSPTTPAAKKRTRKPAADPKR